MPEHEEYQETAFATAVSHWWESKRLNGKGISTSQGVGRDSNLAGNTMYGFRDVLIRHLIAAGVAREDIHYGGQFDAIPANLPSYFRASKNWDLIVCKNSLFKAQGDTSRIRDEPKLIAAIEFKSQQDSIGNNQNNRMEESIGNATDFWASYENKNFIHLMPRPWLGYLFIGKYEDDQVGKSVKIKQPHFPSDPAFASENPEAIRGAVTAFQGPSYAERYRIFLERMVGKKLYDGACFITSNERIAGDAENYRCFYPHLSGAAFIDGLTRHIRAYYPD